MEYHICMKIQEVREKATPIFKRYGIVHAAVFGSVSRGEETPESDVDIMVKIGTKMDLVQFIQFRNALRESLGRNVDVVTESSVSPYMKSYIINDLRSIYEA